MAISIKAGNSAQNPNMYQYQSHGQMSQMKNAKVIQAAAWTAVAKNTILRLCTVCYSRDRLGQ